MGLTENEKNLLRNSWSTISALGLQAVGLHIFVKLFTDHPAVIPLFKNIVPSDITVTYENLEVYPKMAGHALGVAEAVNEIVICLDNPDAFAEYMETIAGWHKNKSVEPAHFEALGGVLLSVIRSVLKNDATDDVMAAWKKAYGAIQGAVLNKV